MHRFILRAAASLLIAPWLTSCVSNYNLKAQFAHRAYHEGRYEDALAFIDKVRPAGRDRLLYLLDKGMILHAAEKYKESNKILLEAEELSDALQTKSISREISATLWSEEATEYAGEKYERTMIPVIRMLNYIMLDEWDEALVEVRRLITIAEKIYSDPGQLDNAFALYLSAIIWETLGEINDALISYGQIEKHKKQVPYYGYDISAVRRELGLSNPLPPKNSEAWAASKNYRRQKGELIVIAEAGRSPIFEAEMVSNGLFTISLPELYSFRQDFKSAKVFVDGAEAGTTYPFYNIAEDIIGALKDRQKRSFIRKMIKLPVETGLYAAGGELIDKDDTESKVAGAALLMLALSMSVSEKADERSWRTLPAQFHLGRFFLPEGKHDIEIRSGADSVKKTAEVKSGKPQVVLLLFPQSSNLPVKAAVPVKPGHDVDLAEAKKYLEAGEEEEESGNYEEAAYNYMMAYKSGLANETVAGKVVKAYSMTDESFRRSERGTEIASSFADSFLTYNPH